MVTREENKKEVEQTIMKKHILIVASSLRMGGLEKCIISLCNAIDYEQYEVDLYLFNDGRDLLPELNQNVDLLPDSPLYSIVFNMPILQSCIALLKEKEFRLFFYRIRRFIQTRLKLNLNTLDDWKYMQRTMLPITKHYDVAIGFEEGTSNYYITECVDADVKDCWVHTDISAIDTNSDLDQQAFSKADYICTVSKNSLNALMEKYPQFENKYRSFIMPALNGKEMLVAKSQKKCVMDGDRGVKILSIGRLVELKGFHLCVKSLNDLLENGYDVTWYVAGEGSFRDAIEQEIGKYNLKDRFVLLGNCQNPYPLIRCADICVQPSSYEGFSFAVWEEKLLDKAVVVTDIPSNHEMITDGINGMIVQRDSDHISKAIQFLIDHPNEREKMEMKPANCYVTTKEVMRSIESTFEKYL